MPPPGKFLKKWCTLLHFRPLYSLNKINYLPQQNLAYLSNLLCATSNSFQNNYTGTSIHDIFETSNKNGKIVHYPAFRPHNFLNKNDIFTTESDALHVCTSVLYVATSKIITLIFHCVSSNELHVYMCHVYRCTVHASHSDAHFVLSSDSVHKVYSSCQSL